MRRDDGRAWTWALVSIWALLPAALHADPSAESAAAGAGLAAAFGPGAAALGDATLGAGGNPALLGCAEQTMATVESGLETGALPAWRLGGIWPGEGAGTWGVGVTRSTARISSQDGWARTDWQLAHARRATSGFAAGTSLRLRTNHLPAGEATSFGLDLGAHWQSPAGRFQAGACLRDLVRPDAAGEGTPAARALDFGVAATWALAAPWRCTAVTGIELADGESGDLWLGARMAWRERLTLAIGGTHGQTSGGVGWRHGPLHIEYVLTSGDAPQHRVTVISSIGPTRAARRSAAAEREAARLATQVDAALRARRGEALRAWLARADSALAGGEFVPAAEYYRSALLWSPEDAAARDGLLRAQRGMMLARADSLLAHHDSRAAAVALEQAAQLFPADSVVASRWQAVRHALDAADRNRNEAAQHVRDGFDAYSTQRHAAACRAFEAALQLDPANAVAAEFLPRARSARARQEQEALTQARGLLKRRDPAGAREVLLPLQLDGPPSAAAAQLLAQAERALERQAEDRRLAEARRSQDAAREDRAAPAPASLPQLTTAFEAGMQKFRAGDLPAAMLAWEQVARRAPHFGEVDQYLLRVYRVVGLECYTEGRLQDAIEIWEKALKLEPENAQVRRYLEQANAKLQRAQGPREPR